MLKQAITALSLTIAFTADAIELKSISLKPRESIEWKNNYPIDVSLLHGIYKDTKSLIDKNGNCNSCIVACADILHESINPINEPSKEQIKKSFEAIILLQNKIASLLRAADTVPVGLAETLRGINFFVLAEKYIPTDMRKEVQEKLSTKSEASRRLFMISFKNFSKKQYKYE